MSGTNVRDTLVPVGQIKNLKRRIEDLEKRIDALEDKRSNTLTLKRKNV